MKLDRRRALFGFAAAGFVMLASPVPVWADDDDDKDPRDYRNGSGYRNNHENRPNGNPHINNVTDQPGQSYQQSVEAGGESRETVFVPALKPDKEFIYTATSGNYTEVLGGQLAQDRAASADVKQFGQRMIVDHSQAARDSTQVAIRVGVDPPTGPAEDDHKRLIENLMARSGQDFDRFYMRAMVLDHRTDIAEYEQAARELSEPTASYAARYLPILREHLMMAQDIAQRVGADLTGT